MNSQGISRNSTHPKVLITGGSSGIGEATVRFLESRGFVVYAGVRSRGDYERIGGMSANVVPVVLDVTDQDSVDQAVVEIEAHCGGMLHAVVNNAGIAVVGPLEKLDVRFWEEQMAVNVVGVARVTKSCLPMLRKSKGRVINIGSAAAHLTLPMFGPYSASKRAVEGLSDALRREVRPMGVRVVVIHPGQTATPIYSKSETKTEQMFESTGVGTEDSYYRVLRRIQGLMQSRSGLRGSPERVAKCVHNALQAKSPRPIYFIGWDARVAKLVDCWVPKQIVDWAIARKLGS